MATTVQISDATKQLLDHLKEQRHASSFDAVIATMAKKELHIPDSLFGKYPHIRWTKADRAEDRDL
jgi:hypothetical protein